jgi:hypothetical protein
MRHASRYRPDRPGRPMGRVQNPRLERLSAGLIPSRDPEQTARLHPIDGNKGARMNDRSRHIATSHPSAGRMAGVGRPQPMFFEWCGRRTVTSYARESISGVLQSAGSTVPDFTAAKNSDRGFVFG